MSEVGDNAYVWLNTDGWGYRFVALPRTMKDGAPAKNFVEETCYKGMGKCGLARLVTLTLLRPTPGLTDVGLSGEKCHCPINRTF